MKTLLILNDPPYGTERVYNALRLAHALLKNNGQAQTDGGCRAGREGRAEDTGRLLQCRADVEAHHRRQGASPSLWNMPRRARHYGSRDHGRCTAQHNG